ncbi:MAG: tail protein X [Azoarcus sp.]|jgi:phage tail protein X|nr:tail protein X [Azoarcus sp.]
MRLVRARQNEALDLLIWRKTGRTAAIVEAVIALNPGIGKHLLLPEGYPVRLPDAPPAPVRKLINIWD